MSVTKLTTAQVSGLSTTSVSNLTDHAGLDAVHQPGRGSLTAGQIGTLTSTEVRAFAAPPRPTRDHDSQLGRLTTTALGNFSTAPNRSALSTTQVQRSRHHPAQQRRRHRARRESISPSCSFQPG